jgi:hypothetical protein
LPPRRTLDIAVEHWMVDTVHDMLDVSLKEDNCGIWRGRRPEYFSILRKLALNVIAPVSRRFGDNAGVETIAGLCCADWDYLMAILTLRPGEMILQTSGGVKRWRTPRRPGRRPRRPGMRPWPPNLPW